MSIPVPKKYVSDNENVALAASGSGNYAFDNVVDKVKSVKWMDNNEELSFIQNNDILVVNFTLQKYGTSLCVRVADAEIE